MKCFVVKRFISILVKLRYFLLNLLKYKENDKKMCNTNILVIQRQYLGFWPFFKRKKNAFIAFAMKVLMDYV